jgi:immune inhibitor A
MVKGLKTKDNIILNKVKNMKKEMSRLTLIFASLLISIAAWGVKVHPGPAVIKQSDGTEITVYAYGDCDNHWYATADGVLLYHEGFDYFVAKVDADGNLVPTKQLAHEMTQRSAAEVKLVKAQNRKLFYDKKKETSARLAPRKEPVENDETLFFHTGSPKALVILAEFTDSVFKDSDPKSVFEQYLNADVIDNTVGNSTVGRNYGSVKKYFSDMSFGTFTPQFDIYGPYQMSQKLKYYGDGDKDHMDRLIPELCQLADADIDFSQYDQNNDGKVDLVYIICASYSQSWTQNSSDCIWPKSGSAANYGKTDFGIYDGKGVYRFGVHTELNAYPGAFTQPYRINGVGLFCHEFSHCLGLPDIYPTTKTAQTALNPGMENWDLMDGGEYVYNGYYPTEYTAWEREAMGWITIEELTDSGDVELVNIDRGGKAYRIRNENHPNEYFIIQNIQQDKWNAYQEGHGMIVFHVDYDQTIFNNNKVNDIPGIPRMSIVPADGKVLSSYNVDNVTITSRDYYTELAGDPFPGTSNVTQLDETMDLPNFQVHYGETINKAFHNITETEGVVRFKFINDFASSIQIEPTDIAQLDSAIYVEKAQGCKGNSGAIAISLKNTQ